MPRPLVGLHRGLPASSWKWSRCVYEVRVYRQLYGVITGTDWLIIITTHQTSFSRCCSHWANDDTMFSREIILLLETGVSARGTCILWTRLCGPIPFAKCRKLCLKLYFFLASYGLTVSTSSYAAVLPVFKSAPAKTVLTRSRSYF